MSKDNFIQIKSWNELSENELKQMNDSHAREWKIASMTPERHNKNIFFLLKDPENYILSQGQLIPVSGVVFMDKAFDIFGVGGIIANVKGQGFGREIMNSITEYLNEKNKSAVGFTGVTDFYEKCGFNVSTEVIKRFVYINGGKKIVNTEDTAICYLDSDDRFMEIVLKNPSYEVSLPREPDW